ncbi:MAG: hypothetical protein R3F20_16790 [Planctomycetota bacterium]
MIAVLAVLLAGAAIGAGLHVFVVDLHGSLVGQAAVWALVAFGLLRLWRGVRTYRRLDDRAPTRRLEAELEALRARLAGTGSPNKDAPASSAEEDAGAPSENPPDGEVSPSSPPPSSAPDPSSDPESPPPPERP